MFLVDEGLCYAFYLMVLNNVITRDFYLVNTIHKNIFFCLPLKTEEVCNDVGVSKR